MLNIGRYSLIAVFLLLLAVSLIHAIQVIKPISKEINTGDIIEVGIIGPGQTLDLLINPNIYSGGIFEKGGQYDKAVITSLPEDWKAKESAFYGDPLQVKITADKNAPEGEYLVNITIIDELGGEKLKNITFTAKVKVVWDVLGVEVSPEYVNVGTSQPARIYVTLTNKGTASDTFDISITGVKRWEFTTNRYLAPGETKTIMWETVENERETYTGIVKVSSTSSPLIIKSEKNITVNVVSQNVFGDYKATNHGIIIFPIFEGLIYSLAGLLANLF